MSSRDIVETINLAVRDALVDGAHLLSERELTERADDLLSRMPTVGGTQPTAGLLLRRYRGALQKELCAGRQPRPLPPVVEDELRELTRAVIVTIESHEGFSVDISVLLALVIRSGGLAEFCAIPASTVGV